MPRLAVNHTHLFVSQLPQFADKATVVTDGKGNGNGQIGTAEQERFLDPWGSGHCGQYIHLPRTQSVFLIGAVVHHLTAEANVQLFFQAFDQIRHEPGRLTILGILERRPIRPEGHSKIRVLIEKCPLVNRQGNGGGIQFRQLGLQPRLADRPVLTVVNRQNCLVEHPIQLVALLVILLVTLRCHFQHHVDRLLVQQRGHPNPIDHGRLQIVRHHRNRAQKRIRLS